MGPERFYSPDQVNIAHVPRPVNPHAHGVTILCGYASLKVYVGYIMTFAVDVAWGCILRFSFETPLSINSEEGCKALHLVDAWDVAFGHDCTK
jgi:hypothetical protein